MVVGEAPGAREEAEKKPFVGPAGGVLTEMLYKSGIDPEAVFYTNISKYRPPGNLLEAWIPKNGIPHAAIIDGLGDLEEEIKTVNPNVIVALGNWPLHFLTGKHGITNYRGSILEGTGVANGRKVVATYHPSFILRGMAREKPVMRVDLQRVRTQSAFPEIRRPQKDLILDPPPDLWAECKRHLLNGPIIDFDIEGSGRALHCIGFTTDPSWAVVKRTRTPDDIRECKDILESGVPLCAQNGMYDCSLLEWHHGFGVIRHLAHDTMVGQYVLNIEYPKGLDFLCSIYTEQPYYKDMVDWDAIHSGKQPIEDVLAYNAIDVWVTSAIREAQEKELRSDPKFLEAFQFDMKKLHALWPVSARGVKIDTPKLEGLKKEIAGELHTVQLLLNAINGGPLNVKSNKEVPELLFKRLGVPSGKRTPTGQYKNDDETLAASYAKCTNDGQRMAIELIRKSRELRDIESKSLEVEFDDDGRMRCTYDPTKTDTRRLSSRKFYPTGRGRNLQNESTDPRIRSLYIADEGMEFAYADLKGAEFFVVAELTQDAEMLRLRDMVINGTGNIHKETAGFLFDKDPATITKESSEYFLGKKTRHSSNYMVGWSLLMSKINQEAYLTGVTVDAATTKKLIARYKALHPGLERWWREVESELRATRVLRNLFGFKREFHDSVDSILPNAVAFVPQSTIGDALNYGLLACHHDRELTDAGFQMLLQIHDAIGFQYTVGARDFVLPRVRKNMDVAIPVDRYGSRELHIPVEIAIGRSWGELKEWDDDLKAKAV